MSNRGRKALIILAVIATLVVNGLANALPINGMTTGEISDSFDVLFVPAGYVFSIWGLIYLALVAYAGYRAFGRQAHEARLRSLDLPFLVASLANISWIFLWHYQQFALTLVAMIVLLLALITIYRRLREGEAGPSTSERWLLWAPFSLYLGWVSVATIANVTSVLAAFNWDGFGLDPSVWAIFMLVVGLALAMTMAFRHHDIVFVLVFVWAYVGIGVAQAEVPPVSVTAYLAAAVLGATALIILLSDRVADLEPSSTAAS